MIEPYEIAIAGDTYRVAPEQDEGTLTISVHSDGQLRFSLPFDTPRDQVDKFIRVYALGFTDGKTARGSPIEDHIRGRLRLTAEQLGRAAGHWKAGAK